MKTLEANLPQEIDKWRDEIQTALTIKFTEQRLLELFSQGKLSGTIHTCIGQEFVGVAVGRNLTNADYVFSNHRCHGHFLSCGGDVGELIAEVMGKATGVCSGLGGSQHLQKDGFFSNGILGGIAPVAAGLAMAQRLAGGDGIAVVFLGDGTLGEGVLYEALNLASKWELPLLCVLENNTYAQSTHQRQTLAGDMRRRFEAFGFESKQSDTWNWTGLFADMSESIARVRDERRPFFHQVDTYRLMAHSKGDDDRPESEIEQYRSRDPLNRLLDEHEGEPWLEDLLKSITDRIDASVAAGNEAGFARIESEVRMGDPVSWREITFERERVVGAVREGLREALSSDPRVILIGEDIESPYGGAFKATAGLSADFPGRVRNTPISEAGIVGMGNGLALAGWRPVVEIMFGDFMTLAMDQWINHAAKFSAMYDGKVSVPITIRTPMGGKRGYGPTHSQSLEKHFLGLPGTQVLCLHHRYSPALLYQTVLQTSDQPTLVIENKLLYGQYADPEPPVGYRLVFSNEAFPVARLMPTSPADVTMVALGGMSLDCERALQALFEEQEIILDLFFPSRLYPLDIGFMRESLEQTGRLVVVEEGQSFASLSSELLAQIAEARFVRPVRSVRVCAMPRAIPSSRHLEEECLPGPDAIIAAALGVFDG